MTLTSWLGKKYRLDSSENFEYYMEEIGVEKFTRMLVGATNPVVELTKEGDEYILTTESSFKNTTIKFTPGVEFTQETPEGIEVTAVIEIDGNTLHEVQVGKNGMKSVIDRKFSDDQIEEVIKYNRVTATRIFKLE